MINIFFHNKADYFFGYEPNKYFRNSTRKIIRKNSKKEYEK